MSDFEVESDVPIPDVPTTGKYPWPEMQAGDSFFVPCSDEEVRSRQTSLLACGTRWCERNNPSLKAATRAEEGGFRVWLIWREDS